jgi:hypothetical protein
MVEKIKVLLLGSHMNYNLEHYVYMNLIGLGNEVRSVDSDEYPQ